MVTIDLRDPNLAENIDAIIFLKNTGVFTDDELQTMYARQFEKDSESE